MKPTAPMTPADCDLRGLTFMPLDVMRLRDSELALLSTGDEFKAAVLLWCASWHQIPAGSLPNEDRALMRFAGLDAKPWAKARVGALRGWVICSDGRLYHSVVAEKANEAWAERLTYRKKRDADRERLAEWRDKKRDKNADGNGGETPPETPPETRFTPVAETSKTVEGQGRDSGGKSSEDKSSAQPDPLLDPDGATWLAASLLLQDRGGMSERSAKAFFGKLLSANGLDARDMLTAIMGATVNKTQDPQGYLTKAAQAVAKRRAPLKQAVGFV